MKNVTKVKERVYGISQGEVEMKEKRSTVTEQGAFYRGGL